MNAKLIGKTIKAWDKGKWHQWGIIRGFIENETYTIFLKTNPKNYQWRQENQTDVEKWIDSGMLKIV